MNSSLKKNGIQIILILLLIAQVLVAIYFGGKKEGYHIDEIYTCTLANYEGGFVSRTEGAKNEWKSGEFYKEIFKVTDEERFNYTMVYENQEIDVHPPMYYYLIHVLSSVLGEFSKWTGIMINIILSVLTSIVLFCLSKKVFDDDKIALICTFVWGLSVGTITSIVFIRMYMLLTLFSLMLMGLHLKSVMEVKSVNNISGKTLIALCICTLFGILTQYYYLIFCFFLCGSFFLYLFFSRNWKALVKYCCAEIGALAIAVLYFPTMLKHIFSGYRGEQAFNEITNTEGFQEKLKTIITIINEQLFNGWAEEIIIALSLVFCVWCWLNFWSEKKLCREKCLKKRTAISDESCFIGWLLFVCSGYTMSVAKIAPFQTDRYFMCIYPLVVIMLIGIAKIVLQLVLESKARSVLIIIFLVVTLASYSEQEIGYLFEGIDGRSKALLNYQDCDAIVLNGAYNSATDHWLYEYGNYKDVFICEADGDMEGLKKAVSTKDLSNGFLLYAHAMPGTDEELFEKIGEYINIKSYELVTNIKCRVFFCTLK